MKALPASLFQVGRTAPSDLCAAAGQRGGCGISNIDLVTTYGRTGWPATATGSRPTGKGLYRLGARGFEIHTHSAESGRWQVLIRAGDLLGDEQPAIRKWTARNGRGTTISTVIEGESPEAIGRYAEEAARLLPTTVELDGRRCEQGKALAGARNVVSIDGVEVGIYGPMSKEKLDESSGVVIDQGRVLRANLPMIGIETEEQIEYWYTVGQLTPASRIEPAREGDSTCVRYDAALRALQHRTLGALYESAAASLAERGRHLSCNDWYGAKQAGATVQAPSPMLSEWNGARIGSGSRIGGDTSAAGFTMVGKGTHVAEDVHIGVGVKIGSGTKVTHGASIEDEVHTGENVRIGSDAKMRRRTDVGARAWIGKGVRIEAESEIPPGARIRDTEKAPPAERTSA